MNDYIFDWEENCLNIIKTKEYTTQSHQFMEQAVLFKFLSNQGQTKDQIYNFWLNTNSKLLKQANGDKEDIDFIFGKLWSASSHWKITSYPPIIIYQKEIDFINSLLVFDWLKQYLLALLCIYKYFGKKWCKYNSQIKTFCFSVTKAKRERAEHKIKIRECLNKYSPYEVSIVDTVVSFKINFICNKGDVAATIPNPRHIDEILYLLKCEKKCLECGETFNYTSQTINNDLCPACQKKKRHKQQSLCHKNNRQKSKLLI